MNHLFTPYTIKNIELRNRIVMPPMCMFCADESGNATPWHSFHYQSRAQGGTGLILQEATAVEPRGRISSRDLGIWSDSQIPGLTNIVRGIKDEGSVPGIQLAHAGRKCCAPGEDVYAPSSINFDPSDPSYVTPREMTAADIDNAVLAFKDGARRAAEAGYEILEIHGAHGYLISEFLSPLTNLRTDSYGGSLRNRAVFLRDVVRAIRSVWDEKNPLILRVSAADYSEGGNQPEDLAEMINSVKDEGIDIINVSTGGVVPNVKIPAAPGFQIPAAKIIKEKTGLTVMGGGLLTTAGEGGRIIAREQSDLVFFGRELLRNPYFPLLSARELGVDLDYWPKQYPRV